MALTGHICALKEFQCLSRDGWDALETQLLAPSLAFFSGKQDFFSQEDEVEGMLRHLPV